MHQSNQTNGKTGILLIGLGVGCLAAILIYAYTASLTDPDAPQTASTDDLQPTAAGQPEDNGAVLVDSADTSEKQSTQKTSASLVTLDQQPDTDGSEEPNEAAAATPTRQKSPAILASAQQQTEKVADPVGSRPAVKMPWDHWPRPSLAFVLTGEQHGFFEPCGCTSNQLGGMSRRADLVSKMTQAGWTVRGLDVGGLARRSVRQSQIKFETTIAALKQLDYLAIGIGPEELRLKPDYLLTQHIADGDSPLYFLSANLEFYGIPDLGTPQASVVVEENGLQIGVTSILSDQLQKKVLPAADIAWKDPRPELKKVVADFQQKNVDLRILLSQSTIEESKAFCAEFPEFQIVLTAEGVGDPDPAAPPQKIGNTLLLETGRKGKHVGVLGYYPEDKQNPFRYQLVSLERADFDETPAMIKLMVNYQERLKDEKIVLADAISAPHPSGSTFVGASKCGECHSSAFEKWEETPHFHALESLDPVHKRTGFERLNGVVRMHDPECLSCHVTGWDPQEYIRFRSGFLNLDLAATKAEATLEHLLAGSQCENCHGPGSQHIELVEADAEDAGKSVRVTLEEAKAGMCEKCHDPDNSPNFDFEKYWKEVEHYGLD